MINKLFNALNQPLGRIGVLIALLVVVSGDLGYSPNAESAGTTHPVPAQCACWSGYSVSILSSRCTARPIAWHPH